MNNSIVFKSRKRSWIKYFLILLIMFHSMGYFVWFLNQQNYTYQEILIFSVIVMIIILFNYYRYVNEIEIKENEVLFYLNGRIKKLSRSSLKFREKQKITRALNKYKQLTIWDNSKKKVKIDSDDFEDYTLIKEHISK